MSRNPQKPVASHTEIEQAISSLANAQLLKLHSYADFKVKGLGYKAKGRDGKDLLQESIIKVLEDFRTWPKESVDFFWFLKGVIRSTADSWKKTYNPDETEITATDLNNISADGDAKEPFLNMASEAETPENCIINEENTRYAEGEIHKIENMFKNDPIILEIIDGMEAEMSGPEIQEVTGISKTKYESAIKRMRRKVRKERMKI